MPFEIIKVGNKYKVCKRENPSECYSKKGIPKQNAVKQLRAIGMHMGFKGGAAAGSVLDGIEHNSISDVEIKKYLPSARIITYPELEDYSDIEQLLPTVGSYFILLYLDSPDTGHWTCLKRTKEGINYFCSYGTFPDGQLKWYGEELREKLNEDEPYLTKLLKKTQLKVFYNDIDYQNKNNLDIVTCGRHVINFLKSGKNLKQYFKVMEKLKKGGNKSYDDIVSEKIDLVLD